MLLRHGISSSRQLPTNAGWSEASPLTTVVMAFPGARPCVTGLGMGEKRQRRGALRERRGAAAGHCPAPPARPGQLLGARSHPEPPAPHPPQQHRGGIEPLPSRTTATFVSICATGLNGDIVTGSTQPGMALRWQPGCRRQGGDNGCPSAVAPGSSPLTTSHGCCQLSPPELTWRWGARPHSPVPATSTAPAPLHPPSCMLPALLPRACPI